MSIVPEETLIPHLIEKLRWQHICLASTPDRFKFLSLEPNWPLHTVKIRVHRNHAFEFIQSPVQTFLAYSELCATWTLSDYDDSLSFNLIDGGNNNSAYDIELLWIDFGRYKFHTDIMRRWLFGRLTCLRQLSVVPILLTGPLSMDDIDKNVIIETAASVAGVHVLDFATIENKFGNGFLDTDRAEFQGTRYSRKAQLILAQQLGLKWIPAAIAPRLKAIAIDLDNTLYRGILGEDGPTRVELTDGHRQLQESLVQLGKEGILLTVVSKNEAADVERLFGIRGDFPLKLEHLAGIKANWSPKAENIATLAESFNIAPSAFAMLDDNPVELIASAEAISGLAILQASDDASITVGHLALFPRLACFSFDATDALRVADIRAASQRASIVSTQDPAAYFSALETSLLLRVNPRELLKRLCDIPLKTNQFNLALRRLRAGEVQRFMEAPDHCIVSFDLKDKLSDSGNVGAVYVRSAGNVLVVEELCVSCRALGRSLEDIMIGEALALASEKLGGHYEMIEFIYRNGPRNGPALTWLERITGAALQNVIDGNDESPLKCLRVPFECLSDIFDMQNKPSLMIDRRIE